MARKPVVKEPAPKDQHLSPVSPLPDPTTKQRQLHTFYEALGSMMEGKAFSKADWNSENFVCIHFGTLALFKEDKLYHPLIVRDADISGIDWFEVPNPEGQSLPSQS